MQRLLCIIFITLVITSCGDSSSKDESQSPIIKVRKESRIESPTQNQEFQRGSQIAFKVTSSQAIDSIVLAIDDQVTTYASSEFNVTIPSNRVGTWKTKVQVFCKGESETHYRKIVVLPESAPEELTYEIINTYPHRTEDYTQGLLIHEGYLYESTGQNGESRLMKKDLESGEIIKVVNLADEYFGEGLALLNDKFYQITYHALKGFVYDLDLNLEREVSYTTDSGEGWGLVGYGDLLIMTDKTAKLYLLDPESFTIVDEMEVYDNVGKVAAINELEIINGLLYANVYLEDYIVAIDLSTGEVVKKIDCSGLLSDTEASQADVLNGIAYDSQNDRIYLTGKDWPKLFEVKFVNQPQ